MRTSPKMRLADDAEKITVACDILGGMTKDDKELVAWIAEGHFLSAALGIEVDCRRSNKKNDYQNVQGLLSHTERGGISPVEYVGLTESVTGNLDTDGKALIKLTEYNTQITDLRTQRAELTAQLS